MVFLFLEYVRKSLKNELLSSLLKQLPLKRTKFRVTSTSNLLT